MPAESLLLILISEVRMTPSPQHLHCISILLVITCLFSLVSTDQTLKDDVDVGVFNNEGKLKSKSQIVLSYSDVVSSLIFLNSRWEVKIFHRREIS